MLQIFYQDGGSLSDSSPLHGEVIEIVSPTLNFRSPDFSDDPHTISGSGELIITEKPS
jgi:hypothetical protein